MLILLIQRMFCFELCQFLSEMRNFSIFYHIVEEIALLLNEIANDLIFATALSLFFKIVQLSHVLSVMKDTFNI